MPACRGLNVAGYGRHRECGVEPGAAVPAYPGYGTGYSAGATPITYGGSLVPQSALAQLSGAGPDRLHHRQLCRAQSARITMRIDQAAINAVGNALPGSTGTYPYSTASNTGGNSGTVEEKDYGLYLETGARSPSTVTICDTMWACAWCETHQYITSPCGQHQSRPTSDAWRMAANIPPSTASRPSQA